jgi:hypothetical protein
MKFLPVPIAILWLAAVIAASIFYRRQSGKPVIPRRPPDAAFSEGFASGRRMSNLFTRLGGANNCLLVTVTPSEFMVVPRFPFNLLFMPEIFGLELRIPRSSIRSVERRKTFLGDWFTISFFTGRPDRIALKLRDPDGFARALGKV